MLKKICICGTATVLLLACLPQAASDQTCIKGIASWYGEKLRGRPTASGEPFNPDDLTCAMWDVPFGTIVTVTLGNRSVKVRVNDRGPAKRLGRAIDLSKAAFRKLTSLEAGLVKVKLSYQNEPIKVHKR
jgi:rare lipoprotein A